MVIKEAVILTDIGMIRTKIAVDREQWLYILNQELDALQSEHNDGIQRD